MSQRARSWIASSLTLLAMTEYIVCRAPRLFRLARLQRPEQEIDHLVDRLGRLVDGLRDHLRVEEADHSGAGAERGERQIGRLELARGDALRDHLADHAGDALDMGDADVP